MVSTILPAHFVGRMTPSDILILSSHTDPKLTAPLNHVVYSRHHGYGYLFDVTPYPLASAYDQKLWSIIENMKRVRATWVMWVDHDAYFMNHSVRLETFLPPDDGVDVIICKSPVTPRGKWSLINAGVFFVRNTPETLALLVEALDTDSKAVEEWWNPKEHGNVFVRGGDQERLLYVFSRHGLVGNRVQLLEHTAFNSRVYDFTQSHLQHFVCHLASERNKLVPYNEMRRRFGLDRFLLADEAGADLSRFRHSMFWAGPPEKATRAVIANVTATATRLLKRAAHWH